MVAGAEHPQIAVLVEDSEISARHSGKICDFLAEAVGGDNIGVIPAEEIGRDGIAGLAAQKAAGDLGKGDPGGNAVGIVPDKGYFLHTLPRALDGLIFAVEEGDGAVFLQQIGHRTAMPRQRRSDRLLDLPDAIQCRKGPHRAEHFILAEGAEAIGIPENTGNTLPPGSRGIFPGIAVEQQAAIGGKGGRHGRLIPIVIIDAQIGEGAAGGQLGKQPPPLLRKAGRPAKFGQLHSAIGQKAHAAEIIAVGEGIGAFGLGVDRVQRIEAARCAAHFLPADEQDPVEGGVIGERFHWMPSPVPFW